MATVRDPGTVIVCGDHFDGRAAALGGPTEVLVKDGRIAQLAPAVSRPGDEPRISAYGNPETANERLATPLLHRLRALLALT